MSLVVSLHPLTIMNITDHYVRVKAQEQRPTRVIGALLGTQEGRCVKITNSLELVLRGGLLDPQVVRERLSLYTQNFPELDFTGWYATAPMTELDLSLHLQFIQFCENPVFLVLNPTADPSLNKLPIEIYESYVQAGFATQVFRPLDFAIETTAAERISVDQVTHSLTLGSGSEYTANLSKTLAAVKLLKSKLAHAIVLLERAPNLESNYALLRQLNALCHRVPIVATPQFTSDYEREASESLMTSYLASLTKGTSLLEDLVERFELVSSTKKLKPF
jgi:COP9 signalosome complex subunit 6